MSDIDVRQEGRVTVFTINRPEKLNAIDPPPAPQPGPGPHRLRPNPPRHPPRTGRRHPRLARRPRRDGRSSARPERRRHMTLRTATLALTAALLLAGTAQADEALLQARCGTCHTQTDTGLSRISGQRKTPEGWLMTIVRMRTLHGLDISPADRSRPPDLRLPRRGRPAGAPVPHRNGPCRARRRAPD